MLGQRIVTMCYPLTKCRNNISASTINPKAKDHTEGTNIPRNNLINNNSLKQGWTARGKALKARVTLKNDDPKVMLSHCPTRGHWTATLKNDTLFYSRLKMSGIPLQPPQSPWQQGETQRTSAMQLFLPQTQTPMKLWHTSRLWRVVRQSCASSLTRDYSAKVLKRPLSLGT